jgi:CxxC motif-containing protein (DUF1111 family)
MKVWILDYQPSFAPLRQQESLSMAASIFSYSTQLACKKLSKGAWATSGLPLLVLTVAAIGQAGTYPHNSVNCEHCHSVPSKFGSSSMTIQRMGAWLDGKFVPAAEGGIHHRNGESAQNSASAKQITGDRISLSLLGDSYIEAISGREIEQNAQQQRQPDPVIAGVVVSAPVLEGSGSQSKMQVGRFGWKSQHSSLMSSCADSLRNELGMRNRLYPDEYPTHAASDGPTPFDTPDAKTHKTELERLVDEIRHTSPPPRDTNLAASSDAQAGEKLFTKIGCAICHVPTYKTLPPGTRVNGGTYKVPKFLGNAIIHPYSDFLLHDVGTGDGIPQAAKPEYLDQSTANKFRTAPLWGLRFRQGLMHDGDSPGTEAAIKRHSGEATIVRRQYEQLTPTEKQYLQQFLSSL